MDWNNSGICKDNWKNTFLNREVVKQSKPNKDIGTVMNQETGIPSEPIVYFNLIFFFTRFQYYRHKFLQVKPLQELL